MTSNLTGIASDLIEQHPPEHSLGLKFDQWGTRIDSNNPELNRHLANYFKQCVTDVDSPHTVITAVDMPPPDLGLTFTDWPREGGKTGRKEAFADIEGGRVIHKVRTKMQFLLGDELRVAVGDCLKNDNQVINFAITQYITWLMEHGYVICHSAAVEWHGKGLMFSGFSGGGKSTLSLHLMSRGAKYTSGDRVLIKYEDGKVRMKGVPKLPRINPGTALNNPDLQGVVPEERAAELRKISKDELWQLEEKYDVYIDKVFGPDRFAPAPDVDALFVLNWDRNSSEATTITPVDLIERRDLLGAVMKSPGPFWIPKDGTPPASKPVVKEEDYLPHVKHLRAFEVSGKADFDAACDRIEAMLKDL